ncbi:cysteine protease ATG4B-like [Tubulanus polymorphus]|uniref:cysteine protease ATG4B-like n=1 Tax=Tubulanus polymorphus TaxID=672921 RepID=UPI003DA53A14
MALGINPNMMSASIHSVLTYESGGGLEYEDFPQTEDPVYILGKCYSALYDREELRNDILSKIWLTYRKGFSPIGGTGPTTDAGWGCMLRCGQMILAQALVNRHLGRDWRWIHKNLSTGKYLDILRLFQDVKGAYYSIHQIASMGVSEGKSVGQWFGPNTVAQVLKKLSVYDEWSSLSIHVALDNTVIIDDIKLMCKSHPNTPDDVVVNHTVDRRAKTISKRSGVTNGDLYVGATHKSSWRPLFLIVPLRLGLSEMNSVYVESVKYTFTLPQSVGIIGGKPNHAHWFIGHVGDELIYLDPHTTQPVANLFSSDTKDNDESYHCQFASRMKITLLDPSIALGFYCGTEEDFDSLCRDLMLHVVNPRKTPMFEIHQTRPGHWPPFEPYPDQSGTKTEFTYVDERHYDTDEEFELL